MPDKSFEQQVREELSGLRMIPNESVWISVASNLEKERRRRWGIWLLALLAGLAGAGFWWTILQDVVPPNQLKTSTSIHQDKTTISTDTKTEIITVDPLATKIEQKAVVKKNELRSVSSIAVATREPARVKNTNGVKTQLQQTNHQLATKNTDLAAIPVITEENKHTHNVADDRQQQIKEASTQPAKPIDEKEVDRAKEEKVNTIEKKGPSATDSTDSVTVQQNMLPQSVPDSSSLQAPQTKKRKGWKWYAGFNMGVSGIRQSVGSLFEKNASLSYNSPITGGSGSSGSPLSSTPVSSVARDQFSYGAFMALRKQVGKKQKNSIGIELGYDVYQTKVRVGAQSSGTLFFNNVNRSNEANVYYATKDSLDYISSYHFIHIGALFYKRLQWFRSMNLQWSVGTGADLLLSTNGLHVGYAGTSSYYFRNRSLFHSLQWEVSTGLEFGLGRKQQIFIGPRLQYMISGLSKENNTGNHLFRPSVRLSVPLSGQK